MVVLHPEVRLLSESGGSANNNPVVTRLACRQVSVLLPGDIKAEVEHRLGGRGGFAGEHGAEGGAPRELQFDDAGVSGGGRSGGGGHQRGGGQ